ncbi:cadherin-like beta sandwich domain-containing protein [Paenibacillus sp. CAU 1782]
MIQKRMVRVISLCVALMMLIQLYPAYPAYQGVQQVFADTDDVSTQQDGGDNSGGTEGAGDDQTDGGAGSDAGLDNPDGSQDADGAGDDQNNDGSNDGGQNNDGQDNGDPNGDGSGGNDDGQTEQPPAQPLDQLTDYSWEKITSNISPSAREGAAMAFDELNRKVILFGGQSATALLRDNFMWDGEEKAWSKLPNSSVPAGLEARRGAAIAYDPVSKRIIMFGGQGASGVLGDMWSWNGVGQVWEKQNVAVPSARAGSHMAYDGKQLVLFGGYSLSGSTRVRLGDTWLLTENGWVEATPETSPPPTYYGAMSYDGKHAVLYGGNIGSETRNGSNYQINSNKLWIWDGTNWNGDTTPTEQQDWGRWGHIMAYDGRRVVFYGGEFDWVQPPSNSIVPNKKRPIANPPDRNGNRAVIGWESWNSSWVEWLTTGTSRGPGGGVKDGPGSGSYMSMAFDGEQFVVFGGNHEWGGLTGDTFRFGNELPALPTVTLSGTPVVLMDKVNKENDLVRIMANVTGKAFQEIGVEYREFGQTEWSKLIDEDNEAGALTFDLKGLKWQVHYEARVYATNTVGTAYSDTAAFQFYLDPAMVVADLRYDRSSPSVLHADDKKRMLVVGEGITNLWRRPASEVNYTLKGKDGKVYPLTAKVRNDLELELVWTDALGDGKYDLDLQHDFYRDFVLEDALLITSTGVYEPRDYNEIVVPSSDPDNEEIDKLTISGPFRELPGELGVFRLSNPEHVVLLNQYVKFKGSELTVDMRGEHAVVSGKGMLYVEQSGIMYTLLQGEFEFESDDFSIELNNAGSNYDYLNLNLPISVNSIAFVSGGIRLGGEIKVNFTAGSAKIKGESEIEALQFKRDRFDFAGTFNIEGNFEAGPLEGAELRFRLDTRVPIYGAGGSFDLRKQKVGFEADILFKRGKLDALSFGVRRKIKLGNTGAQITRIGGGFSGLASQNEVPFTLKAYGAASDVITPEIKDYNMVNGNNLAVGLSRYHFQASGELGIYWVPVAKLDFITIWNASGFKGISSPGFQLHANLNLIDIVIGELFAQYFSNTGYNGFVSARIQIPRWVSVIGGKSFGGIDVGVNNQQIFGSVGSGWFGGSAKYVFKPNKFDISLGASKDMKKEIERMKKNMVKTPTLLAAFGASRLSSRLSSAALFAPLANPLETVDNGYDLLLQNSVIQQGDTGVTRNVRAAISTGNFTAVLREDAAQATFPDDHTIQYEWKADHAYNALLVLDGNSSGVTIKDPNGIEVPLGFGEAQTEGAARSLAAAYDSSADKTFIVIPVKKDETWKLAASSARSFEVYELTFVHQELGLGELATLWSAASGATVTAINLENRGMTAIQLDGAKGELKLYKPDGREYGLVADSAHQGWNQFTDAVSGKLNLVADVAQPGEWLLTGGDAADIAVYSIGASTTTQVLRSALLVESLATEVTLKEGQSLLEIEGANGSEILYRPDGSVYPLLTNSWEAGWNARYEDELGKWTILVEAAKEEQGAWKVVGSDFVTLRAFSSTMKYTDLTPFFSKGQAEYTTSLDIDKPGRYMFIIEGGGTDTKLRAPSGQLLPMVFEDSDAVDYNAVLQPAARNTLDDEDYGDVVFTSNLPFVGSQDVLYAGADVKTAGKVQIISSGPVQVSLYELDLISKIEEFSAQPAAGGADNTYRVKWNVSNAKPGTKVKLMLTEQADKAIGPVIAEGLPSSGIETISIPEGYMPGEYWIAMVAEGEEIAPLFAVTKEPVNLTAAVMLEQPQQVQVVSTGNEELTLQFRGTNVPEVEYYQITVAFQNEIGETVKETLGVDHQDGELQTVTIAGYESGFTYTLDVMAVGEANGKTVVSPVSAAVQAFLPEPDSAKIELSFATGGAKQVSGTYKSYDNQEEAMVKTAAEAVTVQVASDQSAEVDLYVNGELLETTPVTAGGTANFDLNALLQAATLEQRDYTIEVQAVNARGDYSSQYSKLYVDRTGPFLYAAGQLDGEGPERMPLSGQAVYGSRLPIIGQTDIGAKLTIDGRIVPLNGDGKFNYYAPIQWDGQTSHTVVAIATDEVGNSTEYWFEVVKGTESVEDTKIKAVDLAGLELGNGYLSELFHPDQQSYNAIVEEGNFKLYAAAAASDSVVTVDGRSLEDGGYIELSAPSAQAIRTVQVKVTAADNSSRTYTINIGTRLSNVAVLKSLSLMSGDEELLPEPAFSGATSEYTVYAEHQDSRITISASAYKQGSRIYINNVLASGATPVDLTTGNNSVHVRVESPDGQEQRTYTLTVVREYDSNAQLSGLTLQGGQLTTDFSGSELAYSVIVPSDRAELVVNAQAASPFATVAIGGGAANGSSAQGTVTLRNGTQTASVVVTAQDGTSQTYQLRIYRGAATAAAAPYLSELKLSGAKISGDFESGKLSYSVDDKAYISSLSVMANTLQGDARLTINGTAVKKGEYKSVPLTVGSNLIVVGVESGDRSSSRQYSVQVEVGAIANNNTRPAEVLSGGNGGGMIANVDIEREMTVQGKWRDNVLMSAEKAKEIAAQAKKATQSRVAIVINDPKAPESPADETAVTIVPEAVALLSDNGITLQLVTPTATLTLDQDTLAKIKAAGTELFFRIVPIRDLAEQGAVRSHLLNEKALKEQLGGRAAEVWGTPATIETNYKSAKTTIVLPLAEQNIKQGTPEAAKLARELAVYIQHSDGEQVLAQGVLQYDAEGVLNGIAFDVTKFSIFSIVRLTGDQIFAPYISGYPDGTFRADKTITRAELATILARQLETASLTSGNSASESIEFQDVPSGYWAVDAIKLLQSHGIMNGDGVSFRPEAGVTRAELATIAARWMGLADKATAFADAKEHWADGAIGAVQEAGIMQGYPDATFRPGRLLLRGEAVTVLNKVLGRPVPQAYPGTGWSDVPPAHWAKRDIEAASGYVQELPDGELSYIDSEQ